MAIVDLRGRDDIRFLTQPGQKRRHHVVAEHAGTVYPFNDSRFEPGRIDRFQNRRQVGVAEQFRDQGRKAESQQVLGDRHSSNLKTFGTHLQPAGDDFQLSTSTKVDVLEGRPIQWRLDRDIRADGSFLENDSSLSVQRAVGEGQR